MVLMGYEDLQYGDREDRDGAAEIARRLWASFTNPPEKGVAKWRLVGNQEIHYISHSLNSLKGGYMGDYIGDYYRGH